MKNRTLPKRKRKRLEKFIDDNFDHVDRGRYPEIRMFCPFCHGGPRNDFSFDINVEKGVARCWRAENCAWKGSVEKLLMEYYDIDYEQAEKKLGGEKISDESEMKGYINQVKKIVLDEQDGEYMSFLTEEQDWIDEWPESGAVPVTLTSEYDEICTWLEKERGYIPEKFLDDHKLFIPNEKSRLGGRVLFEVKTKKHRAYQAYAYQPDMEPKVLAPKGDALTRLLYNFNDCNRNDCDVAFVTEGIFDAARLKLWGMPAVCVFGTEVNQEQYALLDDLDKDEICFCFDNGAEQIAKGAAQKFSKMADSKDISVVNIEREGADPDDLDKEEFFAYFQNRQLYVGDRRTRHLLNKIEKVKKRVEG